MALSDKELKKIKLMQQFKSGERTDLPDVDSETYKLSKIKAMLDKEKDMMEDDEPKMVNSLKNLIINSLKQVHQGAYRDDIYDSFYTELMQNVDAGRVELDGLDVEDEFDNFISVNMDNVSLREVLD